MDFCTECFYRFLGKGDVMIRSYLSSIGQFTLTFMMSRFELRLTLLTPGHAQ